MAWMEVSVTSICASCTKSFGFYPRKHHCRLDGLVICSQCSRFLSLAIARNLHSLKLVLKGLKRNIIDKSVFFPLIEYILDVNVPSSTTKSESIQQLMHLKDITVSVLNSNEPNENYLRICRTCAKFLYRHYRQIYFNNIEQDEIFHYYKV